MFEDAVLVELRLPLEGGRPAGAEHAVVQLGGTLGVDTLQTLQHEKENFIESVLQQTFHAFDAALNFFKTQFLWTPAIKVFKSTYTDIC